MFDMEKKTDNNHFEGLCIFLCLPPYNLNFRYFEIKYLVPRTSSCALALSMQSLFREAVCLIADK